MIDKLDERLKKALIGLLVELVEAAVEEVTSGQKSQETLDTERTGDTSPPLELPDSWASSAAPAESLVSDVPFSADVQVEQPSAVPLVETSVPDQSPESAHLVTPEVVLPEPADGGVMGPPRQVPQESVPVSQEDSPQLVLPPQVDVSPVQALEQASAGMEAAPPLLVLPLQVDVLPVHGDETASAGIEAAPPQLVLPPQMDMAEPVAVEQASESPQQRETIVPVEPPASNEPVVPPKLRLPEEVAAPTPDYIAEEEDDRRSRYEEQSDNARDSMYRLEDTMYSLLNDLTRHLNNLNDIVRGASDRIRIVDSVQMRDRREGT